MYRLPLTFPHPHKQQVSNIIPHLWVLVEFLPSSGPALSPFFSGELWGEGGVPLYPTSHGADVPPVLRVGVQLPQVPWLHGLIPNTSYTPLSHTAPHAHAVPNPGSALR